VSDFFFSRVDRRHLSKLQLRKRPWHPEQRAEVFLLLITSFLLSPSPDPKDFFFCEMVLIVLDGTEGTRVRAGRILATGGRFPQLIHGLSLFVRLLF